MNVRHKQHRRKHSKVSRFLHSWWLGVVLLVALIAGIGIYQWLPAPVPSAGKKDTPQPLSFGVALGDQLNAEDYNKRTTVLNKIKKAGFTEVRLNLAWETAEPTKGKMNWKHLDNLTRAVKKSGLKTVFVANTAPAWARLSVCKSSAGCPPQNPSEYADFVAAAASRYKSDDVTAWEIWNEENGNNFWKPQPNAEQYTELLKASYTAVKKADPNATVLVGGLSGDAVDVIGPSLIDPRTYLTKLYAAGAKGYFDGVAYHPYLTDLGLPTQKGNYNGWAKMASSSNNLRSIMVAHGDADKDLWITEFGIPTGGSGPVVTDVHAIPLKASHATITAQTALVQSFMDDLKRMPWVHSFDWYTYQDDSLAKTYTGAAYGIWQFDGTPKPMLKVLQQAMQKSSNEPATAAK